VGSRTSTAVAVFVLRSRSPSSKTQAPLARERVPDRPPGGPAAAPRRSRRPSCGRRVRRRL